MKRLFMFHASGFDLMLTSPFFRRLFLPYLLLICAATAAVGFFAASTIHESYVERQTEALRENLRLVSHSIGPQIASGPLDRAQFEEQIKKMGGVIGNRITVMRGD